MPRTPEPRFTCTIPSIHDDIPLNVRLYHPDCLSRPESKDSKHEEEAEAKWQKKGIVMAHPYAPMGGSYDDHVVNIVIDEFLRKGWIVGTFNFRCVGAHGSKGRTSWSGRPESDDYISFAAFFMHYLSYLRPNPLPTAVFTPEPPLAPTKKSRDDAPVMVLGGYSYGSMILRHLPPVPSILQPFASPLEGSAADEILLRAHKLADQINLKWINEARASAERGRRRHETKLSVTMGGEETSPKKRRSSRDIRRSMEGSNGRRSLNISEGLRSISHRRSPHPQVTPEPTAPRPAIMMPDVCYLLVSPLTAPISTLAAPSLAHKFWSKSANSTTSDVIAKHRSLVVYGDRDQFSSVHKVREWVRRMQNQGSSQCSADEIEGAGHFWNEHSVESRLRSAIEQWERKARERPA
ncbi:unnamed protein product [Periconia digitata]|uniref:Uncharacterized protein n=1 Tax=Periconia digitata TaxID=1303443 RepID=A0A9W4UI19_9PLEO|nr:unnamed protein product [Periconia digitata]